MSKSDKQGEAQPASEQEAPAFVFEEPAILSEDADAELLDEYVVESLEHLDNSETILIGLENQPDDDEAINTVFRAFHTIKGTSGFLGLDRIQKLAHLAENILSRARSGELQLTGSYADLSLAACDLLKTMIGDLRGLVPGDELVIPDELMDLLQRFVEADTRSQAASAAQDAVPDEKAAAQTAAPVQREGASPDEKDEIVPNIGELLIEQGAVGLEGIERAAAEQQAGDPRRLGEILVDKEGVQPQAVLSAITTQQRKGAGKDAGKSVESSIRVNTGRLNHLVDMVGELVISQSMVAQDPGTDTHANAQLAKKVAHSGKITRELQDLTMALRMVPLKATFDKMRRVLRDLCRKSGKSIQMITHGDDTEVDRNMVEALNDPLMHMIRNAADHGVESPEARAERGKDEQGSVTLAAYHSAGSVVIEVIDDGEGLHHERIMAKALEKGLVESGRALTDDQIAQLIFEPGFSTATQVTDVSGRGVGMDVVKRGIEGLRGNVKVSSKAGVGTTFTIRLPLTMAITDAMLVGVGKECYLLPTISIRQSFAPRKAQLTTVIDKGETVMFQGAPISIIRLHELFDVKDAITDPTQGLLIVIEVQGKRCALLADELRAQQQVVIKSLGQFLGNIPGISGGAILGDGRVGLILDAGGVVKLAYEE